MDSSISLPITQLLGDLWLFSFFFLIDCAYTRGSTGCSGLFPWQSNACVTLNSTLYCTAAILSHHDTFRLPRDIAAATIAVELPGDATVTCTLYSLLAVYGKAV